MSLSEALRSAEIDTASEFTSRSVTGNCKWRTWPNPYVAAIAGSEPTTLLRSKGIDYIKTPTRPTMLHDIDMRQFDY